MRTFKDFLIVESTGKNFDKIQKVVDNINKKIREGKSTSQMNNLKRILDQLLDKFETDKYHTKTLTDDLLKDVANVKNIKDCMDKASKLLMDIEKGLLKNNLNKKPDKVKFNIYEDYYEGFE